MASTTLAFDVLTRYKGTGIKQAEREFSTFGSKLRTFGGVALKAIGGVVVAGGALAGVGAVIGVKTAASLEQAGIAFETLLGSGKKADKFLRDLSKFAARTPFELPGLIQASRQLIGVGASAESVIPTLTAWGDASGALGLSQEQFNRAMLAVTQSMAKGKIQGEELMQLTEAGIPIWPLLAKAMGKTVPELQEMSKRGELLAKDVFPKLEAQMGKDYGGAMIEQSKSMTGLWSTLMDTLNIGLAQVIEPLMPALKEGLTGAIGIAGDALAGLSDWMTNTGIPAFQGFLTFVTDDLAPKVTEAFTSMWDTVSGALPDIDFSAIGADLFDEAKGWGGALIRGVQIGLDTGDWSVLGSTIGKGLVAAVNNIGGALADLTKAFLGWFEKVDWVGIGIALGKQVPSLLIGLAAGILTFDLGGLLKGLANHWFEILVGVLTLAFLPAKLIGAIGKILAKIPLVGKLLEWGLLHLKRWADVMVGAVGRFLGFIAKSFLEGFRRVFPSIGASFYKWLTTLPTAIGVIAIRVWEKAGAMLRGLAAAIGRGIGGVVAKIGELIGRMLRPFARAGSWLVRAGKNVVSGIKTGIVNAVRGFGKWVKDNIVSKITGAFGGIGGFISGLFGGGGGRGGKGGRLSAMVTAAGRVFPLPPGTYRWGRGAAAHGYDAQDLPTPTGTPVRAPVSGFARGIDLGNRSYGKYVQIASSQFGRVILAHLSRLGIGTGFVRAGQIVGLSGSTGNSTGPHLHVEPSAVLRFAKGGIIPEHVVGLGLRSGRGYTFGERGPETVIPGVPSRAGGGMTRVVLEVRSGGSRMDDLLVQVLARAVRVRGGDVQTVLGGG